MFSLKEKLVENGIDPKTIRWDLTPEQAMGSPVIVTGREELESYLNERKLGPEYFFFINVWNLKASVCLAYVDASSGGVVFCLPEGVIPESLLVKAVGEVGALNLSGWYPINEEIAERLIKLME